jgi:hypothetical protein
MTNYDDLFQSWIREKEILDRCSNRTIDSYRDGWNAYEFGKLIWPILAPLFGPPQRVLTTFA